MDQAEPTDTRTPEEARRDAQRPASVLTGPTGHPFHPPLASVATGAWVCSLGFDLVSKVATDPEFYLRSAMWLVLVGVLFGLAAATIGLLDALALPRGTPVFRTAMQHLVAADVAIIIFTASFLVRRQIDVTEAPWYLILLSLLGLGALTSATWSGLTLSYGWGVRVQPEADQLPGYVRDEPAPAAETQTDEETGAETDEETDETAEDQAIETEAPSAP
jgi:uncharacterized membrane protein